jgi:aspartokinase/homoserine dehydrogenase 1
MSFIIQKNEFDRLNINDLKEKSQAEKIIVEDSFAKVSIVGINLTSSPVIAAELFETLANDGINIDMINAGISRISVIIDSGKVQDAVISIHSRFNLGKE